MGTYVTADTRARVGGHLTRLAGKSAREQFLEQELMRYIPQLAGYTGEEIEAFAAYQRSIYLEGALPEIGRPIASLNPTFADSIADVPFSREGRSIYTRASVKENGYRMQLHRGESTTAAFTRQFTPYDLRMFPELKETIKRLPVMIGDAEIINASHRHLAGFNRVQLRIPVSTSYWPRRGSAEIEEKMLDAYLKNPQLFHHWGMAHPDLRLTIAFHGLFAISDPQTWETEPAVQARHLVSLSKLPIDYEEIDYYLTRLASLIERRSLNARVVERSVVRDRPSLERYIAEKEREGHEGVCIVQSCRNHMGELTMMGKSIKVKKYETIDTALLGLYLADPARGPFEENVSGALLGLYDGTYERYLPVTKVNLDPGGVQVKTEGQRARLVELRKNIAERALPLAIPGTAVTLHEVFLAQAEIVLGYIFKSMPTGAELVGSLYAEPMPRGHDLASLLRYFETRRTAVETWKRAGTKGPTAVDRFMLRNLSALTLLATMDKNGRRRFDAYFAREKDIKATSRKMPQPDILIRPEPPIIVETQVFDISWGSSAFSAGFHSYYGTSFRFNNVFAERIRADKSTTTQYETIHVLARMFTATTIKKKR